MKLLPTAAEMRGILSDDASPGEELIARSQAVIADCARMRSAPREPMTVAEALELADYMARVPESVVTCKRMREAVRVLASAYMGAIGADSVC